ncbi:LysE family translocator [Gallaecimonas pentaromativorans]|uniref:Threonine/homoserine/homoserine lactone efflux protein n=1 Tax=Gallaecimonas pentaromativorans TaxID=584787 RepID=A0A3N1P9R2_9GAMM|nr:LysE family translocator [Gallaecimonas pentaromativorans]ROQ24181.1 threonine/homoserine/homoserine lactone efflux protein [Gallaecimonas pentaromativorans]
MSPNLLLAFLPTFFFVSITPGMCMTLSMTLGMTIGVRRTLWMMAGELIGVALVAIAAAVGVAAVMLHYPLLFKVVKYAGGAYLLYLGVQMWRAKGKLAMTLDGNKPAASRRQLASQGFVTAIANPKGWAFMISLLPPFIDASRALGGQLTMLVGIILCTEFSCLMLYAAGGKSLGRVLGRGNNLMLLNRIAGTLMMGVGLWLALG